MQVGQYCFILQNLTGEVLKKEAGSGQDFDYERLRAFLHAQGKAAYDEKVWHAVLCYAAVFGMDSGGRTDDTSFVCVP